MEESIKLVGYGVDTLLINVHYADSNGHPVKQDLDEQLEHELDYLQTAARNAETAVAAVCRATWSGQAMALAAHVSLAQRLHLAG